LSNLQAENKTELFPVLPEQLDAYMQGICTEDACDITSSCAKAADPFLINNLQPSKCCRGAKQNETCRRAGGLVNICEDEFSSCVPDPVVASNAFICAAESKENTQWIGVVLTLIAATLSNMGLNLQKLALRKRHEKKVQKKAQEQLGIFYRLTSLRDSISNFYRNFSNTQLSSKAKPNDITRDASKGDESAVTEINYPHHKVQQFPTAKDQPEFQTEVGFTKLFKNPVFL
jgi:hypothetical protein